MTTTSLRRRRPDAYSVVPSPAEGQYYAFHQDGGDLEAWLYAGGEWAADRGSGTLDSDGEQYTLIHTDPQALVGPGSLVATTSTIVRVWDVEGDTVHTYNEGGAGSLFGAVFAGGWLYWSRMETADEPGGGRAFRLVRARADLSAREVVGTHLVHLPVGHTWEDDLQSVALTNAALLVTANYGDGEVFPVRRIRLLRSGLGGQDAEANSNITHIALADSAGGALGYGSTAAGQGLHRQADDVAAAPFLHWPEAWGIDDILSTSVTDDGAEVAALDRPVGDPQGTRLTRTAAAGPYAGEPALQFDTQPHPTFGERPNLMFIKE